MRLQLWRTFLPCLGALPLSNRAFCCLRPLNFITFWWAIGNWIGGVWLSIHMCECTYSDMCGLEQEHAKARDVGSLPSRLCPNLVLNQASNLYCFIYLLWSKTSSAENVVFWKTGSWSPEREVTCPRSCGYGLASPSVSWLLIQYSLYSVLLPLRMLWDP